MSPIKSFAWLLVISMVCRGGTTLGESPTHPDPSQLQFTRWSGGINVPDPVAISLDDKGTAYVTQTQRRKIQDLDIRSNQDWIADDVGFQTVDDKRDFYHTQLAPGKDQQRNRERVPDLNNDGSHDWHDLTMVSEKIHWLRDSDGDGTADMSGLFAEGFQTEVTGIAAGVLWHNGDIYATIAPDVWRLRDTDGDLQADAREIFATGFGLHIAYAGHDMHGLTVGPDGKIYWTVGDKGISVTSREGQRFFYPNQGGVLRCDVDGRNFEVFAHGLRNVQELAFDAYGNLFGVDNDADQTDEKERFVYIVRDMDAGWRCNYQYRGNGYNPWTAERLWVPHFDTQASYIVPPICNSIDGPAGFTYNPGTALSSDYRNHFFLTGAPDGFQYAFKARAAGASFEMEGAHQIGSGIPLVGINFGPDGALYGVDWGGGYPLNQTGAVWKIDVPKSDMAAVRAEVAARLGEGFTELSPPELSDLLGHADSRIRLGAQFELVKRGRTEPLARSLQADSEMRRVHAIWALGQLARAGDTDAKALLLATLRSSEAEMRAQAARTLTDVSDIDGNVFLDLLTASSDRVRFMAAIALSKHPTPAATPILLVMSDGLPESERYLRFAVSRALANCASGRELVAARQQCGKVGRLNLVVALRAHTDARLLKPFLADENPEVATEAARALHDDITASARLADLAEALATTPHRNEAFVRRALNANYRLGDAHELRRVLDFARDPTESAALRLEALTMLGSWRTPDLLDRVDGRRRDLGTDRKVDQELLQSELSKLALAGDGQIQAAAIRAARDLGVTLATSTLRDLVQDAEVDVDLRIEALQTLARQNDDALDEVLETATKDRQLAFRMVASELLVQRDPVLGETHLLGVLDQGTRLRERQHALAQLGNVAGDASARRLASLLEQIAAGSFSSELALDVLDAAAARDADQAGIGMALDKANRAIEESSTEYPQPLRKFLVCRDGGNPEAGASVFKTHLAAQCTRCHTVGNTGSNVGPNLKGIASKRDRDYLLRSLISPSTDIDEKFQTQSFLMFSGRIIQGLVQQETAAETVIVDNQGKEIRLDNDEIDVVTKNTVSIMPDMTEALTRREIRDLVAYLAGLK